MIPPFTDSGWLPPGIHRATIAEIDARFGQQSELRRVQMESVHWMVDCARRVGVKRIVLNGSFVTDIIEPNDVDCVLQTGEAFPMDSEAEQKLIDGLPFLDLAITDAKDFNEFVNDIFANDRWGVPKGMIEVTFEPE